MPTAAALILFLALGTNTADAPRGEPIPECCAAKLSWTDLTGRARNLESYRGEFLVLNFWATWCLPCREELPELIEIQNRYGIFGVQVVGASADTADHRADVLELAREFELNFPVLLGADSAQMEVLGLGDAIPATVIVDPDGNIVERFPGVFKLRQLENVLDDLIDVDEPVRHAALDHDHDHDDAHEHSGGVGSLVPS